MHEGKHYYRVKRDQPLTGMIVVSIVEKDGEPLAWIGRRLPEIRTATTRWSEELIMNIRSALAYAEAEVGSPGVDRVAVFFEGDHLWNPDWGTWEWVA